MRGRERRNGADGVVHRVALDHAPGGLRLAHPAAVVQGHDRLQAGRADGDQLRAAAEAGEQVRLHQSGGDAEVGLHPAAVECDRDVVGRGTGRSERDEVRRVAAVVDGHLAAPRHLGTEHGLDDVRRVGGVRAPRDEHRHVGVGARPGQLGQHGFEDRAVRVGPGAVGHGDDDLLSGPR